MASQSEIQSILAKVDEKTLEFNGQISALQYSFQSTMNALKAELSIVLHREISEDDFLTVSLQNIMDRIKVQGDDTPSRILCLSNSALSNPSSCFVPVVCSDGSLQLANLFRSASFAYSFGSYLPHLDFACTTTDTTSTTSCELQGIAQ